MRLLLYIIHSMLLQSHFFFFFFKIEIIFAQVRNYKLEARHLHKRRDCRANKKLPSKRILERPLSQHTTARGGWRNSKGMEVKYITGVLLVYCHFLLENCCLAFQMIQSQNREKNEFDYHRIKLPTDILSSHQQKEKEKETDRFSILGTHLLPNQIILAILQNLIQCRVVSSSPLHRGQFNSEKWP